MSSGCVNYYLIKENTQPTNLQATVAGRLLVLLMAAIILMDQYNPLILSSMKETTSTPKH